MKSAFYYGTVAHRRYLPQKHQFRYPFFMWFLNLDQIEMIPDVGIWFSVRRFALSRFNRADYLGPDDEPLSVSIKKRMESLTGRPVQGEVCGLMNLRTLGLYFSPVNFYFGYDVDGCCTHLLAEVSNTPWNERHCYAHDLTEKRRPLVNQKQFHVSPFNPMEQEYRWFVDPPKDSTSIRIEVHDQRGHVFDAEIDLKKRDLSRSAIMPELMKRPIMTAFIVVGIYWQALKIFLKKIPYIPYKKEAS